MQGGHTEDGGCHWIGEHHCSDYIVSSPQMVLAAIAMLPEVFLVGMIRDDRGGQHEARFALLEDVAGELA